MTAERTRAWAHRLAVWWCRQTHSGGTIERDHLGRINWRCAECGRWSDHPVPLDDERAVVDRDLAEYRKRKGLA